MSRVERPFVMPSKQKDGNPLVGNARFEGFCVDMLEHISELVGFNYVMELVPDNNYGAENLTVSCINTRLLGFFYLFTFQPLIRILLEKAFFTKHR